MKSESDVCHEQMMRYWRERSGCQCKVLCQVRDCCEVGEHGVPVSNVLPEHARHHHLCNGQICYHDEDKEQQIRVVPMCSKHKGVASCNPLTLKCIGEYIPGYDFEKWYPKLPE